MDKITWELSLKTVSEANCSEHWTKSRKRHLSQQFFVRQCFSTRSDPVHVPCRVTLTRLNSRALDEGDNLPMSFKWIRDEIGECILCKEKKYYIDRKGKAKHLKGRYDDSPLIEWVYSQEKSNRQGIRIEIEPTSPEIQDG